MSKPELSKPDCNANLNASLRGISIFGAALFFGGAVYINSVVIPSLLEGSPQAAIKTLTVLIRRSKRFFITVTGITTLSALGLYSLTKNKQWLAAAGMHLIPFVFSIAVVQPFANKRIEEIDEELTKEPRTDIYNGEIPSLIKRWSLLHAVRTLATTAAFAYLASPLWH